MTKPLFEVCVDSYASCLAAKEGGGDRLELCANLVIGGTTPSEHLFTQVRELGIPANILIRPRFGDFLYDQREFEQMAGEIARFRDLGANGVVIGALTRDGDLDTVHLRQLMKAAGSMEVTLHRAFDMARDLKTSLEQAIDLGFTTILTSGGKASAPKGSVVLAELNDQAAGQIRLMAGAGVNVGNIPGLYAQTGITAFHGSCRTGSVSSEMVYRNPEVNMGLPGFSEYEIMRTDPKEVARCVRVVRNLNQGSTA